EKFSYGVGMFVRSFFPGYPLLYAESVGKALAHICKIKVELVVMNVDAYSEDDHYMIKLLRRAQPNVRILIFAYNDDEKLAEPYLNSGVDGFITKSMSTEEYQSTIDNVMNRKTPGMKGEPYAK